MNIVINIQSVEQAESMKRDINAALRIIWDNHYNGPSATFDSETIQAVHDLLYKHSN